MGHLKCPETRNNSKAVGGGFRLTEKEGDDLGYLSGRERAEGQRGNGGGT
jgi:hypothetical protein